LLHVDCFSQTEPATVPSNLKLHVSSSQPRLGSRCFAATQWALTFPNLRRHLMCINCNIKVALYALMCNLCNIIPVASFLVHTVFMCNVQFFDSQQSIYINQTLYYRTPLNMLRVLRSRMLFPQRYFQTGPPTLGVGLFCLDGVF